MFEVEKFYPFINVENMAFYIVSIGNNPVGTSMYIQDGDKASLELIATSQTSRNRSVGTAAVLTVLRELQNKGVKTATLRARHDTIEFYKKLGFQSYYDTEMMLFEGIKDTEGI